MLSRWAVPFTALISRLDLGRDPLWPIPATPRERFPFDVSAFLADQDAHNDAEIMRNVRLQLRGRRAWLLREPTALREQVEVGLAGQLPGGSRVRAVRAQSPSCEARRRVRGNGAQREG